MQLWPTKKTEDNQDTIYYSLIKKIKNKKVKTNKQKLASIKVANNMAKKSPQYKGCLFHYKP